MTEDAQRELEQRALRNVRGLLDRMESDEALSRRKQVKMIVVTFTVVFVGLVAVFGLVSSLRSPAPAKSVDLTKIPAPEAAPRGATRP